MISSQYCGDYRCYNLLLVTWQKRHHCQCHQYLFQLRTVFWRYRCLMESLLVTITLQEHCHCRCDFIIELQDYNVNDTQVAKSWFLNFLLARLVFYGQPGQIYVKLGSILPCVLWSARPGQIYVKLGPILPEAKWHMVAAQQSKLCVPQRERERPPNFIISYISVRQKWHFSAVKFMCVTVEVISATFCILFHLCCKLVPSLTRMVSIGLIIIIVWSTGWSLIALH